MHWNARHGFGCALALALVSLGINQGLRIGYESIPSFADWVKANSFFAESAFRVLQGCLWLLVVYIFSRTRSIRSFVGETGFDRRPTFSGWLLSWAATGLGLLDLYVVLQGWSGANESAPPHYYGGSGPWAFFVVYTVILTPFFEEVVMRGFLFQAFRRSYGVVVGTGLVLCVQTYFHWGLVVHDFIGFLFLTAGGIALCAIREYTGSTWNCVLFHAAYNATVLRQWPVCVVGMLAVLSCVRYARPKDSPVTHGTSDDADSLVGKRSAPGNDT